MFRLYKAAIIMLYVSEMKMMYRVRQEYLTIW